MLPARRRCFFTKRNGNAEVKLILNFAFGAIVFAWSLNQRITSGTSQYTVATTATMLIRSSTSP
jgi:hypothetical protein